MAGKANQGCRMPMAASLQHPMTQPGIFFFKTCEHIIRCLPQLPKDPTDPDDVYTEAEDHNYDDARYRIQWKPSPIRTGRTIGLY